MTDEQKWHWGEGNKYAIEAAKSFLLVNGAAAVGTLTFIGNFKQHPTYELIISMVLFASAAMASALLFFFAYVTQLYYGNANRKVAVFWHIATYVLMAINIGLFVAGIVYAARGFLNLSHASPCNLTL